MKEGKYRAAETAITDVKKTISALITTSPDKIRGHVAVAHEKLGEAAARMELASVLAGEDDDTNDNQE